MASSSTAARDLSELRYSTETTSGEGALQNVARTGVFVRTEETLPSPGDPVVLQIAHSEAGSRGLAGVVCWAGVRSSDAARGFTVEIQTPPSWFVDRVESLPPREPNGPQQRCAPRIQVDVAVVIADAERCETGQIWNISLSGACIGSGRMQLCEGARIRMTFGLQPGEPEELHVAGRVVWSSPSGRCGVEFEELRPGLKSALLRLMDRVTGGPLRAR